MTATPSSNQQEKTKITIKRRQQLAQYFTEKLSNKVSMQMMLILGGEFIMGAPETELDSSNSERPQHQVSVPSFFIGKYLVTQAQWRIVAELPQINRKLDPDPSEFKGYERPVEQINWYEAKEFCDRLSNYTNRKYRLPTEAEWEYACRAGTNTPFNFGETITTDLANYRGTDWKYEGKVYPGNYGKGEKGIYRNKTTEVGSFPANDFGLCDIHGNVWEWCEDDRHDNYEGAPTDGSAWLSESGNNKVIRGGSWFFNPFFCRSASRELNYPELASYGIGIRVVCEVPAQ